MQQFLEQVFHQKISDLTQVQGGERSDTYAFNSQDRSYILRINNEKIGFEKDKFAAEQLGSLLPIPPIIDIGTYEQKYYAISVRFNGESIRHDQPQDDRLIQNILATLDQLHQSPVQSANGYGWFDAYGIARYGSWQAWVTKPLIMVKKPQSQDMYTWKEIFSVPFVNGHDLHQVISTLNQLIRYVPSEKYLIHGDFGPGNILISNHQVTGIIDWNEAAYGDFLYDIAYLDFWTDSLDILQPALEHYQRQGKDISNFHARIHAHQLLTGLTALGIYAALNLSEPYTNVVNRIHTKKLLA